MTDPIITNDAPLVFVTLLQHKDVYPYLVAIKSVFSSFGEGGVVVINDGSLTEADIGLLESQVLGIDIRPIADVDMALVDMKGGCWERLVTLVKESEKRYVIQVDADLVAQKQLGEVVELYKSNRSFALGNYISPGLVTFEQMSSWWTDQGVHAHDHVQVKSELVFKNLPRAEKRFYRRTTAAFVGMSKGSGTLAALSEFCEDMKDALGSDWNDWGSEQVASNYLIANTENNVELSAPEYVNNVPEKDISGAKLVHFFGSFRYYKKRYQNMSQKFILDRLSRECRD